MVYEERMTNLAVELAYEALKAFNVFLGDGVSMFEAMSVSPLKREAVKYAYSALVNSLKGRKDETIDEYIDKVSNIVVSSVIYSYTGSVSRYSQNDNILKAITPILREKWESIIPVCIMCSSLLPARTNTYCSFDCAAESGDFIND